MPQLPIRYRPTQSSISGEDCLPLVAQGQSMADVPADVWQFMWSSSQERIDYLRSRPEVRTHEHPLMALGALALFERDKKMEFAEDDYSRPEFATIRHIGPSWMDIRDWDTVQMRQGGPHYWTPKPEELSALLDGKPVDLPTGLKSISVDQILIAIPSHTTPGMGGRMCLRGSIGERIETALFMGTMEDEGYRPAGLSGWHRTFTDAMRTWTKQISEAGAEKHPFASIQINPGDDRVVMGELVYLRQGRLNAEDLKQALPYLIERSTLRNDLRLKLDPTLRDVPVYNGGTIRMGTKSFGIRTTSMTIDQVVSDVKKSEKLITSLCDTTRVLPGAGGQRNNREPYSIDTNTSFTQWDPRGFVWFLRQMDICYPTPKVDSHKQVEYWINRLLEYGDKGECIGAKVFFERLAEHCAGQPGNLKAGADLFEAYAHGRLLAGMVDHLCSQEIPGDYSILKGMRVANTELPEAILNAQPQHQLVHIHQRSMLERDTVNADKAEAFSAKATSDTLTNGYSVLKVTLATQYPTLSEAVHAGTVPSYPQIPALGELLRNGKVQSLGQTLSGQTPEQWFDGKGAMSVSTGSHEHGIPVQDIGIQSYIENLFLRCAKAKSVEGVKMSYGEGPEISSLGELRTHVGQDLFKRWIEFKAALADGGWAGNAPAIEVVSQVLKSEPLPIEFSNTLAKYTRLPEREGGKTLPISEKNEWVEISSDMALDVARGRLKKVKEGDEPVIGRIGSVDVGNPFLLGRVALTHPTKGEARAEVVSWLKQLPPEVIKRIDPSAYRGEMVLLTDKPGALDQAKKELDASWKEFVERHNRVQARQQMQQQDGYVLGNLLQLELYQQAHSSLGVLRHQAVSEIPGGTVKVLALAWSGSPVGDQIEKPEGHVSPLNPESFREFVWRMQNCKSSEDLIRETESITGMRLSKEGVGLLRMAEIDRKDREQMGEALTLARKSCLVIEQAATFVRVHYPLADAINPTVAQFHPDRAMSLRIMLSNYRMHGVEKITPFVQMVSDSTGKFLHEAKTIYDDLKRAKLIEPKVDDTIKHLNTGNPLAVPFIAQAKVGQNGYIHSLKVGGLGGAYINFLYEMLPDAKQHLSVEFDRSGSIQGTRLAKWSREPWIKVDLDGIADAADKTQLSRSPQVRNFPKNSEPVAIGSNGSTFRRNYAAMIHTQEGRGKGGHAPSIADNQPEHR